MTEHEGRPDEAAPPDEREQFEDYDYVPGGKRRKGRGLKGCVAVLVALAVLVLGFYFALTRGVSWVADQFQGPEDYPGPGTGSVEFTVNEGDVVAEIGRNLKADGVTASVQAFIDACQEDCTGIQVGAYELQKEMKAADVREVLIDPGNLIGFPTVTIPEGLRLTDIVTTLADNTDFPEQAWNRALEQPDRIGLPDYAEGNAEGYLFPATYEIKPGMKPVGILKMMVSRWAEAAEAADLEGRAAELGRTPAELMIIASLVEAEGRGEDMYKISRAIYNRLDNPDNGITNGLLQIDASVNYGLDQDLGVGLTSEQLQQDTPYNTYTRPGLPPTPIEAPGDLAIDAAANPAEGPWLFWVTVDLESGETKFTDSYEEFLEFDEELCQNAPETC
jgi:UPF0755 protein